MLQKPGEHGFIVGMTGSGKTEGANFLLRVSDLTPIIVLDTKQEKSDPFARLPTFRADKSRQGLLRLRSFEDFAALAYDELPEYVLLQPSAYETADPMALDEYLNVIHQRKWPALVYIDETYHVHDSGRAGPGLIGLLTRGRALDQTVLMGSQRPQWVSEFAKTEARHFYIYTLQSRKDRKYLDDYVPDFETVYEDTPLALYHFFYYNTGQRDRPKLSAPVPPIVGLPPPERQAREWI